MEQTMKKRNHMLCALIAGVFVFAQAVWASDLVYTPVNPSFGGSPLNGQWLLGYAGSQNTFKEHGTAGYKRQEKTLLQKVADDFSRRAMGRVENEILDAVFDKTLSASDLGSSGSSGDAGLYIEVNQYGDGNTSTIDMGY